MSVFCADMCTAICVSNRLIPGSWPVAIRWKMKLLSVKFSSYTTYLPCTGALIPQSIIILKYFDNIDNNYNDAAHL